MFIFSSVMSSHRRHNRPRCGRIFVFMSSRKNQLFEDAVPMRRCCRVQIRTAIVDLLVARMLKYCTTKTIANWNVPSNCFLPQTHTHTLHDTRRLVNLYVVEMRQVRVPFFFSLLAYVSTSVALSEIARVHQPRELKLKIRGDFSFCEVVPVMGILLDA